MFKSTLLGRRHVNIFNHCAHDQRDALYGFASNVVCILFLLYKSILVVERINEKRARKQEINQDPQGQSFEIRDFCFKYSNTLSVGKHFLAFAI